MIDIAQPDITDLTLRSAVSEDEGFLLHLYLATRTTESQAWSVDAIQRDLLLQMQFRARKLTYESEYADAEDAIICLGTGPEAGTPVGRHLVARRQAEILGVDLAILPKYQGRGIGTRVLQDIQRQCAADRIPFRLQVLQTNPASRLYTRLGFKVVSQDSVYLQMEWNSDWV
ncbi:GNAT family N-acetyltransferase [Granulicella sp. S190]|uniref:GNAT family N-acetyltransferase n=1 Tax=Granulicella sp. S190 TaxID=1747226 RepID=UPI00131D9899|nr:GNAT family N-acetyltransferase [Granulicella sp. S190]